MIKQELSTTAIRDMLKGVRTIMLMLVLYEFTLQPFKDNEYDQI